MNTPTDTTPPTTGFQPAPRKPHRVRRTLLIIGGAFLALILIIVVASVAAGNKTAKAPPASAPSPTPSPSVVSQSYVNANPDSAGTQDASCTRDKRSRGQRVLVWRGCDQRCLGDNSARRFCCHIRRLKKSGAGY